jgi:hypothetical protein
MQVIEFSVIWLKGGRGGARVYACVAMVMNIAAAKDATLIERLPRAVVGRPGHHRLLAGVSELSQAAMA